MKCESLCGRTRLLNPRKQKPRNPPLLPGSVPPVSPTVELDLAEQSLQLCKDVEADAAVLPVPTPMPAKEPKVARAAKKSNAAQLRMLRIAKQLRTVREVANRMIERPQGKTTGRQRTTAKKLTGADHAT